MIGFVTNAGWLGTNSSDGMRKCLAEEFSSLYVFHLRGNARTSGELRRKEKDNVFGMGSRAPIAISLLVKNPQAKVHGQIHFHDIGDYLSREDKLEKISTFASIAGISAAQGWQAITPDAHGDWLQQRDDNFSEFVLIGTKRATKDILLFEAFSNGVVSNRDAWVFGYSKKQLAAQCSAMIDFYNSEVGRYKKHLDAGGQPIDVQEFVKKDTTRISWGGGNWQAKFAKGQIEKLEPDRISQSLYRPFTKMWHYGGGTFNHSFYSMPRIFPDAAAENRVIMTTAKGAKAFSCVMSAVIPDLNSMEAGAQCFPLYLYDEEAAVACAEAQDDLFASVSQSTPKRPRRDALTDAGLAHFRAAYPGETISKEDVFYYVYGLLHSPQYREKYADNLAKELPRIPCVKTAAGFWGFSEAGRKLAELHIGYETVAPYPLAIEAKGTLTDADYRVEQMKYGKRGKDKDLTTLHYNGKITLTGIPLAAYDYVVNGKPALDWVVERQRVKTDKDNNGHLQASFAWCKRYGIGSEHTLQRAISDLIAHGFIYRTRSHGANGAWARYAVTWLPIKRREGLFLDGFLSCAWREWIPPEKKGTPQKVQDQFRQKCSFNGESPAKSAGSTPAKSAGYELIPCRETRKQVYQQRWKEPRMAYRPCFAQGRWPGLIQKGGA